MSKSFTRSRLGAMRPLRRAAVLCALLGSGAYLASVSGQSVPASTAPMSQAAIDEFKAQVLPILSARCMTCHNDQEYAGDVSMETLKDPGVVAKSAPLFEKMHDRLERGKMPPASEPPLAAADKAQVMGWIERTNGLTATPRDAATADPGRVTARRLNRTEYNNTIRDLLGVTLKPADEFPVDDSGYGFDNIGDVLTVSPMLMEKYLRAARTVSKAAVFGESYSDKPTLIVKLSPKKDQDDLPASGNISAFSLRGAFYTTYRFPVDAEYEFRWRYVNLRGLDVASDTRLAAAAGMPAPVNAGRGGNRGGRGGGPAATGTPAVGAVPAPAAAPTSVVLPSGQAAPGPDDQTPDPAAGTGQAGGGRGRIAGPPIGDLTGEAYQAREEQRRLAYPPVQMVFTIDGKKVYEFGVEGNNDYNYTRGDTVVHARLTAGDHALRISFPPFANMTDPTAQYGNDGRRRLFIDYLDVRGPYQPSTEPPPGFKKIFICGAPGKYTPECARQIVENLALRAYRRPATPQEVQRLMTLISQVQKQDSFEESIRVAIEAILMSPNFLFRIERDR